ncbi:MAG: bifunctional phosphopantothenoylcysteine decarboxylase/phosphopantothenate--cysteine ligase CoaBC [Desulfocapsa sp.]|uniref:Coenzyme A biosynthesis bifunctional protein CoaBC n=1 Tax=Desulfotalea psychrophila TaxID=84980 RepID=A0ABS3ATH4_9BACT|nr:bifunctional phosphopantothenoylcysteine decarboxylase/phosphopantothenate--cysteine ligase CoaBC [Desulfocapsa sp.]MBN4058698.1 bifunctional phosphopantothenoylcysteine decarboxylase/phosphopantothenate--cysteine ligase CoaBC [Desulfocapsa sp. AH-315-J15]MBN4068014.1 bifunctional phosphopantothenoylcysteine decarboxylase/phosphopantothenate--cysteine ligase CoaBC [Desulfotalea psychrophila]
MSNTFCGEKIVVGVTGSIAAFKVAGWVSSLAKEGADVRVVMTESACRLVTPLTFAALSGNPVLTDMFAAEEAHSISHIQLGSEADLVLIAPATANTIARIAHGFADDLLTTTVLAASCQVLVAPAMNSTMLLNPATKKNIQLLKELGHGIIEPVSGQMACKTDGPGRLPEWDDVREQLLASLVEQDLQGENILITAGPTREALDPARFLSNRSSGKMGYALARTAKRRGADVLLVSGPTPLPTPHGVKRLDIQTAEEMHSAVVESCQYMSVIIKAAAVSDFCPEDTKADKVKKEDAEFVLKLKQTLDILKELGENKDKHDYLLVGFAAESCDHHAAGKKKLINKNLDLIAINDISGENSGFEADTNEVTLLDSTGFTELPLSSKEDTANLILDRVVSLLARKKD